MFKSELSRYLRNKSNIFIVLVSFIPIVASFIKTHSEQNMWLSQAMDPKFDLAIRNDWLTVVNGYNWLTYISDFVFSTDYIVFFILILATGFGVVSGTVFNRYRSNGYGSLIKVRASALKFTGSIVFAQIIYIIILMVCIFIPVFVVSIICFPTTENIYYVTAFDGMAEPIIFENLCIIISQCCVVISYVILVMTFSQLSDLIINNRYIILTLPIFIYFVPIFVVSIMDNFSHYIAVILQSFISEKYLLNIKLAFSIVERPVFETISGFIFFPVLMIVLISLEFVFYARKIKRVYI